MSKAAPGSLGDRMKTRSEQLERGRTEWFPIPGWEDMLEVELRALGFAAIRKVVSRHERVRDQATKELYSMCDQILQATMSFREIREDGEPADLEGETWTSLAQRLPNCPETPTDRQALLTVVPDDRILFLVHDWGEWARTTRKEVDQDVVRDFAQTGSPS